MKRSIGLERVYKLGDYKSLHVTDTIEDLPEEIMLNEDIVNRMRYLQLLNADYVCDVYLALGDKLAKTPNVDERISILLEEKSNTLDEIKNLLSALEKTENK
jgi:hypothetical protein